MSGIVVADFESVIKNSELRISDVSEALKDLNEASLNLRKSITTSQLSFLTDNLYSTIKECRKMVNKLTAYRMTLINVLRSYQNQEQTIVSAIRRVTP